MWRLLAQEEHDQVEDAGRQEFELLTELTTLEVAELFMAAGYRDFTVLPSRAIGLGALLVRAEQAHVHVEIRGWNTSSLQERRKIDEKAAEFLLGHNGYPRSSVQITHAISGTAVFREVQERFPVSEAAPVGEWIAFPSFRLFLAPGGAKRPSPPQSRSRSLASQFAERHPGPTEAERLRRLIHDGYAKQAASVEEGMPTLMVMRPSFGNQRISLAFDEALSGDGAMRCVETDEETDEIVCRMEHDPAADGFPSDSDGDGLFAEKGLRTGLSAVCLYSPPYVFPQSACFRLKHNAHAVEPLPDDMADRLMAAHAKVLADVEGMAGRRSVGSG